MPIDASVIRRVNDAIAASRHELTNTPLPSTSAEQTLGLTFTPGDRVVDTVTGQPGVVHAGYTETTHVQPARPKAD